MKHYFWLGVIVLSLFTLIGCASHTYPYLTADFTQENWMPAVDTQPNLWTRGADHWFFTGDPNATEMASRHATSDAAISTTMIRVPDFTKLKVCGDFQVQIFGTYGHNSVYLYGPNEGVRNVSIKVVGDMLVVDQVGPAPRMRNVIIRIGMNQLTNLIQLGHGTIEGIRLHSNGLAITSSNQGNIYLSGNVNLTKVMNTDGGSITVIGARTPCLDIVSTGSGCVNICGNVGVRSIIHHGVGDINIIGANSGALSILADGFGKVGIQGVVNLQDVKALDKTKVFVTNVSSGNLSVRVSDHAYVGLAGHAANLNLEVLDYANFLGRYLCTDNAYVKTQKRAHVNVSVNNKLFASASEDSSIYIFGKPNMISQFVTNRATIVPVATGARSSCGGITTAPMLMTRPVIAVEKVNVYEKVNSYREEKTGSYRSYPRPRAKLKHIHTRGEG